MRKTWVVRRPGEEKAGSSNVRRRGEGKAGTGSPAPMPRVHVRLSRAEVNARTASRGLARSYATRPRVDTWRVALVVFVP